MERNSKGRAITTHRYEARSRSPSGGGFLFLDLRTSPKVIWALSDPQASRGSPILLAVSWPLQEHRPSLPILPRAALGRSRLFYRLSGWQRSGLAVRVPEGPQSVEDHRQLPFHLASEPMTAPTLAARSGRGFYGVKLSGPVWLQDSQLALSIPKGDAALFEGAVTRRLVGSR